MLKTSTFICLELEFDMGTKHQIVKSISIDRKYMSKAGSSQLNDPVHSLTCKSRYEEEIHSLNTYNSRAPIGSSVVHIES